MYELIEVAPNNYYLDCPAKIGLIQREGRAIAIDSGSDKDAGKKVLRTLQAQGWTLDAVYNTHSHADHIGGNRYLQEQTGCRIFAPELERDFVAHPLWEPASLYGGFPPNSLRHKFLMAQESRAEVLTQAPEQIIPLPGHSFQMVGFRTAEDVVYLADALSSRETLDKYGIGYVWDVGAYLETLKTVEAMTARIFVPSHAAPTEDIAPLARYNIDVVLRTGETIRDLCADATGFDDLLEKVFAAYGLTMTAQQHALIGSTVRSYLTWLENLGQVAPEIDGCRMVYRKV